MMKTIGVILALVFMTIVLGRNDTPIIPNTNAGVSFNQEAQVYETSVHLQGEYPS